MRAWALSLWVSGSGAPRVLRCLPSAVKHACLAAANAASAAGAGAHETGERAAAAAAAAAAARDDDDEDDDEDARVGESPAHVETDGLSLDEVRVKKLGFQDVKASSA